MNQSQSHSNWWQSLLPIYGLGIRMRFVESSNPGFFHQGALSAWLRSVLGSPEDYGLHLCSDAPETGHRRFASGEDYRFTVFGIGEMGREYLALLPEAIASYPGPWDAAMPFRDNWRLDRVEHWASGEELHRSLGVEEVPLALDADMLTGEIAFWRQQQRLRLQVYAPLRITRGDQKELKGNLRFCRDIGHAVQMIEAIDLKSIAWGQGMDGKAFDSRLASVGEVSLARELGVESTLLHKPCPLWFVRIDDALRRLVEEREHVSLPRTHVEDVLSEADLFWADAEYKDEKRNAQQMGGLLGEIVVRDISALSDEALALLVIGQYLGVGQRRVFGNGRYRLFGEDGVCRFQRFAAGNWLGRAMDEENLHQAWLEITKPRDQVGDEDSEASAFAEADEDEPSDWDADTMLSRAGRLLRGEYRPPALHGFVHEDADGGLRPLAAPPLSDRVLQRAVHQVISPALDLIMDDGSFGYRAGRSRFQVRDMIQRLYREGYRWIFESDIRSFFDTVSWEKLRVRLDALLADEQAVAAILAWMRAPVVFKGQHIERSRGLPQGSPLSPVLANLMLDDFDHDLVDAGCRLIRFADDFVIVAKTREDAEQGGRLAEKALLDVGLQLKREKTRVIPFSQGFRFLGFMFVDGMAVECSPNRSEDAGQPPPQSWLAKALAHADDDTAREEQLRGTMPTPLAMYENRGQMLIFCGEPAMLFSRGGRARIERDDECLMESPWTQLDGIVLFGRHHMTTPAMLDALANDVPIHLASGSGAYRGMVVNPRCVAAGELWLAQQRLFTDDAQAMRAAKSVVDARIRHMRETLRRRGGEVCEAAVSGMEQHLRETEIASTREQLNGVEGNATKHYFVALKELVPEVYGFHGRERRPPTDPFNALLSLGYTHLYAHMDTLLRAEGLMPERGFYHRERSGHAALASDLLEPFRHVIERCALSMVQRGKLGKDDFSMEEERGCRLTAAARRVYMAALSEAMRAPLKSANGGEPAAVLDHMHRQAIAVKLWVAGKSSRFDAWRMR